ncbi:hypothetical protein ACH4FX_41310 [Streptomyces sp. NPDC018019]|uniref:hypothetical protein n=1 Tax=Streptomyces sp. NPDC018019 TaxID=3365030 RepID=UPI0037A79EF4
MDGDLLAEAEALMTTYEGHAPGLADTVNAALAWRLRRPLVLTFDRHSSDMIAPRPWDTASGTPLTCAFDEPESPGVAARTGVPACRPAVVRGSADYR